MSWQLNLTRIIFQAEKAVPLTYAGFLSHWLQILKYPFEMISVVFKGLMKWFFIIFFCLHFFFLLTFSLLLTSLVKKEKEKKRNLTFPKSYAAREKKKSKISTSSLQKQEGVLGVIKHMLDNWYYPLARYCSYLHSLKLHEWSLVINSYMLAMACWLWELPSWITASPSSPTHSSCKVPTIMNLE